MFDRRKAARDGVIEPQKGTDAAFDGADRDIGRVKEGLQSYLVRAKRELRCKTLKYFGTKPRHQIEIKDSLHVDVPDGWYVSSRKKGSTRYSSPEIDSMLERLAAAETALESAKASTARRLFARFASFQGECSFIYRYILRESCSQFDSLPSHL